MNYKLIVLTHGDASLLKGAVESFNRHVTPGPSSAYVHVDGAQPPGPDVVSDLELDVQRWYAMTHGFGWTLKIRDQQVGFCEATYDCWQHAADGDHDFVFWLEHDFRFTRDVDLTRLASLLDAYPHIAQMALMRQPVNEVEVEFGGVVASRPGEFRKHLWWLEHRSYWTTNPSLFRRQLAVDHAWPRVPFCEGIFGLALIDRGLSFGMWGGGEPWVEHVGERTGFGY